MKPITSVKDAYDAFLIYWCKQVLIDIRQKCIELVRASTPTSNRELSEYVSEYIGKFHLFANTPYEYRYIVRDYQEYFVRRLAASLKKPQ